MVRAPGQRQGRAEAGLGAESDGENSGERGGDGEGRERTPKGRDTVSTQQRVRGGRVSPRGGR